LELREDSQAREAHLEGVSAQDLNDLLVFAALALVTNLPLPIPFDPVLLAFAAARPQHALAFVIVGGACAGLGAVVEATLLPRLGRVLGGAPAASRAAAWSGRWFYLWVALVAASPVPIWVVRAAVVRARPRPLAYALAIVAGRLPRYALLVGLLQAFRSAAPALAVGLTLAVALVAWIGVRRAARPLAA
jgi:hypothetical protein